MGELFEIVGGRGQGRTGRGGGRSLINKSTANNNTHAVMITAHSQMGGELFDITGLKLAQISDGKTATIANKQFTTAILPDGSLKLGFTDSTVSQAEAHKAAINSIEEEISKRSKDLEEIEKSLALLMARAEDDDDDENAREVLKLLRLKGTNSTRIDSLRTMTEVPIQYEVKVQSSLLPKGSLVMLPWFEKPVVWCPTAVLESETVKVEESLPLERETVKVEENVPPVAWKIKDGTPLVEGPKITKTSTNGWDTLVLLDLPFKSGRTTFQLVTHSSDDKKNGRRPCFVNPETATASNPIGLCSGECRNFTMGKPLGCFVDFDTKQVGIGYTKDPFTGPIALGVFLFYPGTSISYQNVVNVVNTD